METPLDANATDGRTLLLVDDDPAVLRFLSTVFDDPKFHVRTAADATACLDCVKEHPIDLVITDLVLRGSMDGLALIRELNRSHPGLPVILVSGAAQGGFAEAAQRLGASAILREPLDPDGLVGLVEDLLRKPRT